MNYTSSVGFPGGSEVKTLLANAGDADLIPGSGRSPGGGRATHPSIFAWRNPWTEESGGLYSPWGSQTVGHDWSTKHTHTVINLKREKDSLLSISSEEQWSPAGLHLSKTYSVFSTDNLMPELPYPKQLKFLSPLSSLYPIACQHFIAPSWFHLEYTNSLVFMTRLLGLLWPLILLYLFLACALKYLL